MTVAPDVVLGLPLEQLAAVRAALDAGHPLEEILGVEGLERACWQQSEVACKARLVSDEVALGRYRTALAAAQLWLVRRVEPLDDDIAAWVRFVAAYGEHHAPFELLAGLGLELGDLSRLGDTWRERLEKDRALSDKAASLTAALAREPRPLALPKLRVGAKRLLPSRFAKRPQGPETADVGATAHDASPLELDRYAALVSELDVAGADRGRRAQALTRAGLDEAGLARIEAIWRPRLEADATLAADFRVLTRHYAQRVHLVRMPQHAPIAPAEIVAPPPLPHANAPSPLAPSRMPEPALPVAAPASDLDTTAPALPVPSCQPLPFSGAIASMPRSAVEEAAARRSHDATSDVIPALRDQPALPWSQAVAPSIAETAALPVGVLPKDVAGAPATPQAPIPLHEPAIHRPQVPQVGPMPRSDEGDPLDATTFLYAIALDEDD